MFIEQGYKGLHEAWRYLVGLIIILFAWQVIGALPLVAALISKSMESGDLPTSIGAMSDMLGSNLFLFLMLLTFALGLIGIYITVRFLHRQAWKALTTARNKINWSRIIFAFIVWSLFSVGFLAIDIYFSPEAYVINFEPQPFLILLVIATLFIPLQTSFEEYFMRGYLMQGIGIAAGNRWVPLIVTSFIFGILHIFNPEVAKLGYGILVFYMGTGLFLGVLTLMDNGLELALGFHAANNLTTALLVTADWTAFQTHSVYRDISEPSLGWDVFIPVLVIYPVLLVLLAKKYGWTDWKERLTGKVVLPKPVTNTASDEKSMD